MTIVVSFDVGQFVVMYASGFKRLSPSVTDTNWLPVRITVQAPPSSDPQTSRTNPEGIKIVNVINKSPFYGSYLAILSYYKQVKLCYMCCPSGGISFAQMYLFSLFSVCLIAMFAVLFLLKLFPPVSIWILCGMIFVLYVYVLLNDTAC